MMQRYAIGVEYDGSNYAGWQRQPVFSATIQENIEQSLSQIAAHSVEITCAGRTDAGVHGCGQIFHFDSFAQRLNFAWLAGGNRYLPADIRLQWITSVPEDFHARYSATARYYRYLIKHRGQPSALWAKRCHWHKKPLNPERMRQAATCLIGEHDFSAFRSAECQSKTPWRFIEQIEITDYGQWLTIDICGNAFLHHMVRNIVGSLLPVGDGRCPPTWLQEVLNSRDRTKAGITAPAQGLYFMNVRYPNRFQLPTHQEYAFPLF